MSSENSNWTDIRGKKINNTNKPRKIDFTLIFKRIYTIVHKELKDTTWKDEVINLPNKYASWVVK